MIYNFRIISPESKSFHLEVKTRSEHTFFDLHTIIQKSLGYESHQLASFYIPGPNGMKLKEISLLDLGFNGGAFYIMHKTKLSDIITSESQQLVYTYDFINDRSFFIELTGIVMEKNLEEPIVTLKKGDAPVQVLGENPNRQELQHLQDEEVLMDFGILDDYAELFGEMEDF